ncbi:TonB-dependent receptor plug domain-containing protein [Steroidobacter cummioxidans]|uniref:TonB-dependent receptor plug domain-containing protein n=1 Tax=Steroidobacter cummioxidans TaxID=1803913 RepID=UPI0012905DDF|nr:TonB-dependent receptor [Steroidobacter cummioxidans]
MAKKPFRTATLAMGAPLAAICVSGLAHADDSSVFALGQITVVAPRMNTVLGDATVSQDEVWNFNVNTLDEAVKLVPGVTSTFDSNGRRNEHDILVRGYGRWQVPLSIDGIRVYLPADNRLDFNRFLTQDLAEIQIRKGYASVLDGPGGLGGAINLVTRKPTKEFESSFQSSAMFGNNDYEGWSSTLSLGTRQDKYYVQASGSYLDRDHWSLSDDFRPTAMEDGGKRNGSATTDWRVNVKVGYTPNETDEYSLSYTKQEGQKGAPLQVFNNPPNPPNSYWTWPWWDTNSIYWLSHTQLSDSSYLKTRLFYNTFDNALWAYDDATYTTQSLNGRFRSAYDDEGYGGSIEAGMALSESNTLKGAIHYRVDEHREINYNRPTHPTLATTEPWTGTREHTWSVALEDTMQFTSQLSAVVGVSYDKNELKEATDYSTALGVYNYPTGDSDAVNAQAAIYWRYNDAAQLHASISSRSRFATIFERFSTRFGNAVPNPDLDAERGLNYEIGWNSGTQWDNTTLSAAVFYNDISNMIQTVIVQASPQLTQTQNVGDGAAYGIELSADSQLSDQLRIGANYSYLHREITDALQPGLRPTGTPTHQALVFVSYQPIPQLTLMPNVELADDRWSDRTGGGFVEVGEYVLANLQVQYRGSDSWELALGARNMLDKNYQLAFGYPEQGRTYYAKFKLDF